MLSLSFWAKNHPVQSWALIALGRIILGLLAFGWGYALAAEGHHFPKAVFTVSAVFYLLAFAAYPRQQAGQGRLASFARRKSCDALLVASSFLAWGVAGNFLPMWSVAPAVGAPPTKVQALQAAISPSAQETWYPAKHPPVFQKAKSGFFQKIKSWKQQFFQKTKAKIHRDAAAMRAAARGMGAGKVILLVLASLAIIIVLGYVTVGVSCNLSCNGQEGAAGLVLVLGLGAIVGILAWMWIAAVRKEKRKRGVLNQPLKPRTFGEPAPPPPLLVERTVQVLQPSLRVCLSDENPKDNGLVTVRMGEQVLLDKINPGKVPYCFDLLLKPGGPDTLSIETLPSEGGAGGLLKMTIEDGDLKYQLPLANEAGKTTVLHLEVKQ